jgi:hypothetical protein
VKACAACGEKIGERAGGFVRLILPRQIVTAALCVPCANHAANSLLEGGARRDYVGKPRR